MAGRKIWEVFQHPHRKPKRDFLVDKEALLRRVAAGHDYELPDPKDKVKGEFVKHLQTLRPPRMNEYIEYVGRPLSGTRKKRDAKGGGIKQVCPSVPKTESISSSPTLVSP